MKDNKENNLKYIILLVVLIIVCIILYARFISTKGLNIKEYPIIDKNIPANFEGLKIVHFSDLLYGRTVNKDDVKKSLLKLTN